MPPMRNIVGKRFGRLLALRPTESRDSGHAVWECLCDCGNTAYARSGHLRSGETKSCGCFQRDVASVRSTKHGHARHSAPQTPEYNSWLAAKTRCFNSSQRAYRNYGGRGIICDLSFSDFIMEAGYKPETMWPGQGWKTSIDRIDNDKGYVRENLRWATPTEQNKNQRPRRLVAEPAVVSGTGGGIECQQRS
jgi:hypothetical protein